MKKNIGKAFVSAGAQKRYLPNRKSTFSVKFIFTYGIFVLLSTHKKAKTIS